MIKVTFDGDEGLTVQDNRAKLMIKEWVHHKNLEIIVSNQLFIYWLRVAVKLGKISPNEVELYFRDKNKNLTKLEIDKHGHVSSWPNGFCDEEEKALWMLSTEVSEWAGYSKYDETIFDY